MRGTLDDIISVVVVSAVTVLFVGTTFARWPIPSRLRSFHIEYVNPLGSFHSHGQGLIRIADN